MFCELMSLDDYIDNDREKFGDPECPFSQTMRGFCDVHDEIRFIQEKNRQ